MTDWGKTTDETMLAHTMPTAISWPRATATSKMFSGAATSGNRRWRRCSPQASSHSRAGFCLAGRSRGRRQTHSAIARERRTGALTRFGTRMMVTAAPRNVPSNRYMALERVAPAKNLARDVDRSQCPVRAWQIHPKSDVEREQRRSKGLQTEHPVPPAGNSHNVPCLRKAGLRKAGLRKDGLRNMASKNMHRPGKGGRVLDEVGKAGLAHSNAQGELRQQRPALRQSPQDSRASTLVELQLGV